MALSTDPCRSIIAVSEMPSAPVKLGAAGDAKDAGALVYEPLDACPFTPVCWSVAALRGCASLPVVPALACCASAAIGVLGHEGWAAWCSADPHSSPPCLPCLPAAPRSPQPRCGSRVWAGSCEGAAVVKVMRRPGPVGYSLVSDRAARGPAGARSLLHACRAVLAIETPCGETMAGVAGRQWVRGSCLGHDDHRVPLDAGASKNPLTGGRAGGCLPVLAS